MAVGLGENSPIVLQLTRDNFNGIIKRHGQYVRWLRSEKCPCAGTNQRANENCLFCKGKGITYRDSFRFSEVKNFVASIDNVIEVPGNDGIIWVRNLQGQELTITGQCSDYVTVSSGVIRGQTVTVKYYENFSVSGEAVANEMYSGTYRIDIPKNVAFDIVQGTLVSVEAYEFGRTAEVSTVNVVFSIGSPIMTDTVIPAGTTIETVSGLVFATDAEGVILAGETESGSIGATAIETGPEYNVLAETITVIDPAVPGVDSVLNPLAASGGQNEQLTVSNLFRNTFTIEEDPTGEVTAEYRYLNPYTFAILNQNLSEIDKKWLVDNGGDAIMIFPQKHDVIENDLIVALNSHSYMNHIFRSTGNIDSMPSFYLNEFQDCFTYRAGVKNEFVFGTDYVLHSGNRIRWISGNKPTSGEQVSISYSYFMTYKVLKDIPNPRSSENNRFPRKVMLKVYTDFNARDGI